MRNKTLGITLVFILLEGWILSHNAHSAVTFEQAKRVWAKLQNKSGYHVVLKYDPDTDSNAYTDGNAIYVNSGMLSDLQNEHQLDMVLGHELGHYIKQHSRSQNSKSHELEADKIGLYYCTNKKKCIGFMKRMRRLYGECGKDGVHPTWSYRINQLEKINAK